MKDELVIIYSKSNNLINKLIAFLGENNIRRHLKQYEQSLKRSSPIFREYYLKNRHPWWEAFREYYELVSQAKSIHKNLSQKLKSLVIDAKKVITLQHHMPQSVKNIYKSNLLGNNARDYLFEIQIAWHFFIRKWDIQWYEEDSNKHPEFLVKTPDLCFDVECKRISTDIARKIHRKDVYSFADKLLPEVDKRKYAGVFNIILKDRLDGGSMDKLVSEIFKLVDSGKLQGDYEISPFGRIALDLNYISGNVIDMDKLWEQFYRRKADKAQGAIIARYKNGRPVDPIELTVMSEKAEKVLDEIKGRISEAKKQLDVSRPGLIVCFLEGINSFELRTLESQGSLQLMANHILGKDEFSHVMGISYSSENMVAKGDGYEEIFSSALFFRNHKCKFKEARTFEFLSRK